MRKILKKNTIDNIVLALYVLIMASASTIAHSDIYFSFFFVFLAIVFLYKKRKVDFFILIILFFWILINILSFEVNEGLSYTYTTFIGVTMKIFISYLMVKIVGESFFIKLLKFIFYLVIISMPFYIIDSLNPTFYSRMAAYLNFMTMPEQKMALGWYIYVYMHSGWASDVLDIGILRNSGFMWEPGAFSMILTFSLLYNFSINGFKWDKISFVFLIALITTFSTSGFLALIVILFAYSVKVGRKSHIYFILFLPVIVYIGLKIYDLDFISGKIDYYARTIDYHRTHTITGIERVNRFGILKYNFEQALSWPFGNGALDSLYLLRKYGVIYRGPNTFAGILYIWGFLGFILFPYFIYMFFRSYFRRSIFIPLSFTVALSFVLFSNPEQLRPIVYSIVFYYLIYLRKGKVRKSTLLNYDY